MKGWIAGAAALYPQNWREQYGEEFAALLDDVKPGWRVFTNVLQGAIRMQLTTGRNRLKFIAATAALGAFVAGGLSLTVPTQYVSTAVLSVTPQPDPVRPASPRELHQRAADRIAQMKTEVLSNTCLASIVRKPGLDLYKPKVTPYEDVFQKMRRDIRIETDASSDGDLSPIVFRISFSYPDQAKARGVVRELIDRFIEENETTNRDQERTYHNLWQDLSYAHLAKPAPPPPVGATVAVLHPASLPKSVNSARNAYLARSLAVGLLIDVLAAFAITKPRRAWQLSGFAAVGCVLTAAASFLIPNRYVSTAVLVIAPPTVAEDPLQLTPAATPATEFIRQMEPRVLSLKRMSAIIQDPALDLYRRERSRMPMQEIVRNMLARDLRIAVASTSGTTGNFSTFTISFSHSDPHKAQTVVQKVVTAFQEERLLRVRDTEPRMTPTLREIYMRKAGENLEVLDPPNLPEMHAWPNRTVIAAAGLGLGLLLGAITLGFTGPRALGHWWQHPLPRSPRSRECRPSSEKRYSLQQPLEFGP